MVVAKDYRSSFIVPLVLVALVCLFLLQRGGLLLFGYSHIAHPGFDETASGVLACDLLDGQLRAPLFAYQYEARSGDGLIEGFLLVPFFQFCGRSLLSLKLCALAAALVCLLCWIGLLTRYHGRGAAIVFASLFAFPPLMFARLNLMGTIASHYLINIFMVVQLIVLFRIMEDERRSQAPWFWLVFGLLAGFGGYVFYSYLIFNGFCLLFLLTVRPRVLSIGRALLFAGGFVGGFAPWILRTAYSSAGETYLSTLIKNLTIVWWSFVQNFFFTLPHSLGYGYPSREMGVVSPLFVLFVLVLSVVVVSNFFRQRTALREEIAGDRSRPSSEAALQGIFFVLYPLFYLLCISLSPMKIGPFEYWPFVGFFGHAGVADVYRYRWLHPLFPFYFAIIGVGMSLLLSSFRVKKAYATGALGFLIFFLLWGTGKSCALYSKGDFDRLRCYKGYNYDLTANRFVLGDMGRVTLKNMRHFIAGYPEENRGEAYRCAGTNAALELLHELQGGETLERLLEEIDPVYLDDFVYGIVRSAQMLTPEEFRPFEQAVVKRCAPAFYTQWGFRYLGYYYSSVPTLIEEGQLFTAMFILDRKVFLIKRL